jgi:hypothetical protein
MSSTAAMELRLMSDEIRNTIIELGGARLGVHFSHLVDAIHHSMPFNATIYEFLIALRVPINNYIENHINHDPLAYEMLDFINNITDIDFSP